MTQFGWLVRRIQRSLRFATGVFNRTGSATAEGRHPAACGYSSAAATEAAQPTAPSSRAVGCGTPGQSGGAVCHEPSWTW